MMLSCDLYLRVNVCLHGWTGVEIPAHVVPQSYAFLVLPDSAPQYPSSPLHHETTTSSPSRRNPDSAFRTMSPPRSSPRSPDRSACLLHAKSYKPTKFVKSVLAILGRRPSAQVETKQLQVLILQWKKYARLTATIFSMSHS